MAAPRSRAGSLQGKNPAAPSVRRQTGALTSGHSRDILSDSKIAEEVGKMLPGKVWRIDAEAGHCLLVALQENWKDEQLNKFLFHISDLAHWESTFSNVKSVIFTPSEWDRKFFESLVAIELKRLGKMPALMELPCGHAACYHIGKLEAWNKSFIDTAKLIENTLNLPPTTERAAAEILQTCGLGNKEMLARSDAEKIVEQEMRRLSEAIRFNNLKDLIFFSENPEKRQGKTLEEIRANLKRLHDSTIARAREELWNLLRNKFEIIEDK